MKEGLHLPMKRFVCIHGHFYQPPRENPWLEAVEVQDSAAPFHDWNARVTAESYAPNTAARLLDSDGNILEITNNFERISFDMGPTLFSWLETEEPEVYQAIIAADHSSRLHNGGHGNAIAQAYNHPILPLCSARDLTTQVLWGIRDFEARFGREPQGMWLPECAVDVATLEALAGQGISFTILAPHQARRVRRIGSREWAEVAEGRLNTFRAYRCRLPSGRAISLFFYDGPLAQAVAFGGLPRSGENFLERVLASFSRHRGRARLVHLATDGETYGHHVPFSEMALAYLLKSLEENPEVALTNYSCFLEAHPPRYEVEIVEDSSWSCSHGIERWRSDCGCLMDPGRGWHQRWRMPLREALDELRDAVAALYEREAQELMEEPWAARDDYVDVILDRSEAGLERFFQKHQARPIGEAELTRSLKLLEMQRHAMLMYTSCGWYFDEISGMETVKVLEYAARVIQLAKEFGVNLEETFRSNLEKAPSNVSELGTGAEIYDKLLIPTMIDLPRVVAHHAISQLFEDSGPNGAVYSYTLKEERRGHADQGTARLAVGRVVASSTITRETYQAVYGVIHLGGYDFRCSVAAADRIEDYEDLEATLLRQFEREGLTEVIRTLDGVFGLEYYALKDLFIEKRRKVVEMLTEQVVAKFDSTYRAMYEENRSLMTYLQDVNAPLVPGFLGAAAYTLEKEAIEAIGAPDVGNHDEAVEALVDEAGRWGLPLATDPATRSLEEALDKSLGALEEDFTFASLERSEHLLELADLLGIEPRLWGIQNRYYRLACREMPKLLGGSRGRKPDHGELLEAALRLAKRLNFNREALPSEPSTLSGGERQD